LLICCKTFSKTCDGKYENITLKKIPKMLLGKCEFGREDYSLNIISMPIDPNEPEFVPAGALQPTSAKTKKKKKGISTPDMFTNNGGNDNE